VLKVTPLGRVGKPEDIGKIAVFLASDDASWMTGQLLLRARRHPRVRLLGFGQLFLKAMAYRPWLADPVSRFQFPCAKSSFCSAERSAFSMKDRPGLPGRY
jgi:hypothetical protein